MRRLVDEAGLAAPDRVEYRVTSVLFLWYEPKLAVVVDLADDPEPYPDLEANPLADA